LPPLVEAEVVDYPVFTDDEYQALMLAEFGPLMPLLTQDEAQSTMLAGDEEIQAPLLPEDESQAMIANENEMEVYPQISPCPDNKEGRKKRKKPPPSTEDAVDEPSPWPSKRAKEMELPSPRATNKMMATYLLERRHGEPVLSEPEGRTVLWCQCKELPRDSPRCALHQAAPFRSWMLDQDQIPTVGSDDGVVASWCPRRVPSAGGRSSSTSGGAAGCGCLVASTSSMPRRRWR
jgi:hypothetical protein